MPEGKNSKRGAMIALFLAVFAMVVGGVAIAHFADNSQTEQVEVKPPVVSPDALVSDNVATASDEDEAVAEEPKPYTRIDAGNLVLFKQKSADAPLEEVIDAFEEGTGIIIAKCYSVDACLKARLIIEPLAQDVVVQETIYTVIIEAFDVNQPQKKSGPEISYMFASRGCGIGMGAQEFTSTGLLEAALGWFESLEKDCKAAQDSQ
ncbi:MAG: hypothetical protein DKT66_09325 [Candidatus Melainabacteria bacterium]|nr:MAG: hypothetical protein DKT66_09325 [Candidatus Melainabacteria bacterium]